MDATLVAPLGPDAASTAITPASATPPPDQSLEPLGAYDRYLTEPWLALGDHRLALRIVVWPRHGHRRQTADGTSRSLPALLPNQPIHG